MLCLPDKVLAEKSREDFEDRLILEFAPLLRGSQDEWADKRR
jgi:hypothetical protein